VIATLLFVAFVALMFLGVPIGAALGLAGAAAIALANPETQWYGLLAVPQNFYAGLGKYPLLAIPMFVLVGAIFDRSGVAQRLVNFAVAIVGRGPGMLATLLDSAVGCAVHSTLSEGQVYTTLELKVNLVRALTDAVPLVRAEGKVIHVGRQVGTAQGRIVGPDGKLYAHATTTCLVFELPSKAAGVG
jgi:uncharacterized protein (TIGR00369 family)